MTEKQERILKVALQLFAEQGYHSTSTSKVAKAAGVSEGLIFRHFKNKEGLLEAIMEMAKQSAFETYAVMMAKSDPREIITGTIEMSLHMPEESKTLWRLIYALKWQADVYDHSISAPLRQALEHAFEKLNYDDPKAEAEAVLILVDGIATSSILRQPENIEAAIKSLSKHYQQ